MVTGLLTGQDLIDGLQGKDLGDAVLLPAVLLRQGQPVFLDDLSLETSSSALGVPLQVVGVRLKSWLPAFTKPLSPIKFFPKEFERACERDVCAAACWPSS